MNSDELIEELGVILDLSEETMNDMRNLKQSTLQELCEAADELVDDDDFEDEEITLDDLENEIEEQDEGEVEE